MIGFEGINGRHYGDRGRLGGVPFNHPGGGVLGARHGFGFGGPNHEDHGMRNPGGRREGGGHGVIGNRGRGGNRRPGGRGGRF